MVYIHKLAGFAIKLAYLQDMLSLNRNLSGILLRDLYSQSKCFLILCHYEPSLVNEYLLFAQSKLLLDYLYQLNAD